MDTVHEEPKKKKFGLSFRRSKSTAANEDDLNTSKHRRSLISFRRSTTGPSDDDLNTSKHRSSGSLLGELLHSYSLRIRYYPVLLSCSIFFVKHLLLLTVPLQGHIRILRRQQRQRQANRVSMGSTALTLSSRI